MVSSAWGAILITVDEDEWEKSVLEIEVIGMVEGKKLTKCLELTGKSSSLVFKPTANRGSDSDGDWRSASLCSPSVAG